MIRNLFSVLALILAITLPAQAAGYGPYNATAVRVVDGDTIVMNIDVFPTQTNTLYVRLRGVDAPELNAGTDCEKQLAASAKQFVETAVMAMPIVLKDVSLDKYGGRIVADVLVNGVSLSKLLIARGHGHEYDGSRKQSWCM